MNKMIAIFFIVSSFLSMAHASLGDQSTEITVQDVESQQIQRVALGDLSDCKVVGEIHSPETGETYRILETQQEVRLTLGNGTVIQLGKGTTFMCVKKG